MAYKDEVPFRDQFINSAGDEVVIYYTPPSDRLTPRGLAIMEHGLFSGSETPHNNTFATIFQGLGFATVQVDATNSSNNASGGDISKFTIQRHALDLAETIDHMAEQYRPFFPQKFTLVGHSMGGISVLENAAHPQLRDHTNFVIALAPVISGKLLQEGWKQDEPEQYAAWENSEIYHVPAEEPYNKTGILPFSAWKEWKLHNVYDSAQGLMARPLFVSGSNDVLTPADDTETFAASLPSALSARTATIPSASHRLKNVYGTVSEDRLTDIIHEFLIK